MSFDLLTLFKETEIALAKLEKGMKAPQKNLQSTSLRCALRMCPGQAICFIRRMPLLAMPNGF